MKTATVTITNSAGTLGLLAPVLSDGVINSITIITNGSEDYDVVISEEGTILMFSESEIGTDIDVAVTGDAEVVDNTIVVTGNCTLTVTTHSS